MSSLHSEIILQVKTELETIAEPTYSFTQRAVFLTLPNEQAVKNQRVQPCIWLWSGTEFKYDDEYVGGLFNELEINILFLGRYDSNIQIVGAEMASDIQKVLLQSYGQRIIGGTTVNFRPRTLDLLVQETDERQAGGHMLFVAQYCTEYGNPDNSF
jgi:hypothetical protein